MTANARAFTKEGRATESALVDLVGLAKIAPRDVLHCCSQIGERERTTRWRNTAFKILKTSSSSPAYCLTSSSPAKSLLYAVRARGMFMTQAGCEELAEAKF